MPSPPSPITQANGDQLTGADGRMQMCTQAGNAPAAGSPLYCTADITCQVNGVAQSCTYVAVLTPTAGAPYMAVSQRVVLGLADTQVFMGALAANPATGQVGVVAIGVATAAPTQTECASLFFRVDGATGTVTQSVAVAESAYLYDRDYAVGRVGDYNDASLDEANVFYGAAERGLPNATLPFVNWATNIFTTALA